MLHFVHRCVLTPTTMVCRALINICQVNESPTSCFCWLQSLSRMNRIKFLLVKCLKLGRSLWSSGLPGTKAFPCPQFVSYLQEKGFSLQELPEYQSADSNWEPRECRKQSRSNQKTIVQQGAGSWFFWKGYQFSTVQSSHSVLSDFL